MKFPFPNEAVDIINTLNNAGFTAYFAGGCVRDMIIEKESDDIDIATNAKPEEVQKLFPKTFCIGANFGVVVVRSNGQNFEVATFRKDSGSGDGRRPDFVKYSDEKNDALRRDFTINGLFYDPLQKDVIDYVDGVRDIKRGILRFIGDGEVRIQEDFLRILRAVRFKNRLSMAYEKKTREALSRHCTAVFNVSAERVMSELNKIMQHHSRSEALQDMMHLGILPHIIPEVLDMQNTLQPKSHHSEGDVFTHTCLALSNIPEGESLELYWAIFLHDIGKAFTKKWDGNRWRYPNHEEVSAQKAKEILQKLKFPKKRIEKICWLVSHEQIFDQFFDMKLSTRLSYYDHPHFADLIKLHKYDVFGSIPLGEENKKTKQKRRVMISQIEENLQFAIQNKLLPSYKKELLSGKEIMDIFEIEAGEKVGEIKNTIRTLQLEGSIHTREEAIEAVKEGCS